MTKHETLIQSCIGKEIDILVGDRVVKGTVEGMVGDSVAFRMQAGHPFAGAVRLLLAASNVVVLSD